MVFLVLLMGCSGTRPSGLGVNEGKLSPCPDSPNCVSSQSEARDSFVEPIAYSGDRTMAMNKLKQVISGMDRMDIIERTDAYLYVESTSKIWAFVDDVEFYCPKASPVIHVRSASRIGYSDLGVNKKRVEAVRSFFKQAMAK